MCTVLLPPGVNPIAVYIYIYIYILVLLKYFALTAGAERLLESG
jgi:hypothetical protein